MSKKKISRQVPTTFLRMNKYKHYKQKSQFIKLCINIKNLHLFKYQHKYVVYYNYVQFFAVGDFVSASLSTCVRRFFFVNMFYSYYVSIGQAVDSTDKFVYYVDGRLNFVY